MTLLRIILILAVAWTLGSVLGLWITAHGATLTAQPLTLHVGEVSSVHVTLDRVVSATGTRVVLWYAPEGIAVEAVQLPSYRYDCVNGGKLYTTAGAALIDQACLDAAPRGGTVLNVLVRGLVPGKSLFTVGTCNFTAGATPLPACNGLGNVVQVVP